ASRAADSCGRRRACRARLAGEGEGVDDGGVLGPWLVGGEDGFSEVGWGGLGEVVGEGDGGEGGVAFAAPHVRGVFVEDDALVLRGVVAGEGLHEVAHLFPLVVVAFEQVHAVLDGHDDGAAGGDFWLGGESEVGPGGEADEGSGGQGIGAGAVFVVAEGTGVEDALGLVEVADGRVAEVDVGLEDFLAEVLRVVVHVVEVVSEPAVLGDAFGEGPPLAATCAARAFLLPHHVFDGHVLVLGDEPSFAAALAGDGVDFGGAGGESAMVLVAEYHDVGLGGICHAGGFRAGLGGVGRVHQPSAHELCFEFVEGGAVKGGGGLWRWELWHALALGEVFGIVLLLLLLRLPPDSRLPLPLLIQLPRRPLPPDIVLAIHLPPIHLALLLTCLVELTEIPIALQGHVIDVAVGLSGVAVDGVQFGQAPGAARVSKGVAVIVVIAARVHVSRHIGRGRIDPGLRHRDGELVTLLGADELTRRLFLLPPPHIVDVPPRWLLHPRVASHLPTSVSVSVSVSHLHRHSLLLFWCDSRDFLLHPLVLVLVLAVAVVHPLHRRFVIVVLSSLRPPSLPRMSPLSLFVVVVVVVTGGMMSLVSVSSLVVAGSM
ncbi:hypothetical protein Tdes44962_MAKER07402, partial [Teratosphaeria destructans]